MNRIAKTCFAIALATAPIAAWAATPPVKGLDADKPVEINADSLEVRQEENKAIFVGDVIAVQGNTKLKSDRMVVHYRSNDEKATAGMADSRVERIEVDGNVLLTTPEETASGEHGIYNVAIKQVKLLNNVVLTRGENVLKGDSLVYDFNTGKSVLNSPYHTPGSTTQKGGRVKALFMPGGDKDQ